MRSAPSIAPFIPSRTTRTGSPRASGTTTTSATWPSCATGCTSSMRLPGSSSGTAGRTRPVWSHATTRAGPRRSRRTSRSTRTRATWTRTTSRSSRRCTSTPPCALARRASTSFTSTAPTRYLPGLHSYPPSTTSARTSTAAASRTRARFWKECLEQVREAVTTARHRVTLRRRHALWPLLDRDRRGRRALRSSMWTTWSTSGT